MNKKIHRQYRYIALTISQAISQAISLTIALAIALTTMLAALPAPIVAASSPDYNGFAILDSVSFPAADGTITLSGLSITITVPYNTPGSTIDVTGKLMRELKQGFSIASVTFGGGVPGNAVPVDTTQDMVFTFSYQQGYDPQVGPFTTT